MKIESPDCWHEPTAALAMNLEIDFSISETYATSPLTPALSPSRGEGEFSAVGSLCFATKPSSGVQCANFFGEFSPRLSLESVMDDRGSVPLNIN
jgi:hypothetical protein